MIPLFKVYMSEEAIAAATSTLKSGYVSQGEMVDILEERLQKFLSNKNVITVNSATSAEHLTLLLLRGSCFDVGDEVLASPLTCVASNWPFVLEGLKIKWVDIDADNLNMNLDDLQNKLSEKTKIISITLWGGMPIDFYRLHDILFLHYDKYGYAPVVMIDAAHAFGARYDGIDICNFGYFTTYSFQAIKHITCVDGGCVVVPTEFYNRGKLLRWYGVERNVKSIDLRKEEDIVEVGTKWHMNNLNAAIGVANLEYYDYIVGEHTNNAGYYFKNLNNISGVTLLKQYNDRFSPYWLYSMLVEDRDSFIRAMKEWGVQTSIVHQRNDIHSCVKDSQAVLPVLDSIASKIVSIPVGWWVDNPGYIVDCIKRGW